MTHVWNESRGSVVRMSHFAKLAAKWHCENLTKKHKTFLANQCKSLKITSYLDNTLAWSIADIVIPQLERKYFKATLKDLYGVEVPQGCFNRNYQRFAVAATMLEMLNNGEIESEFKLFSE